MKKDRHQKILEILTSHDVETQEELAQLLREAGFQVTQATVSRDIRSLKLSKVPSGAGAQKYCAVLQKEPAPQENAMDDRYTRVFREGFSSMDVAQNLVVIRTVSGMAMAVAAALDAVKFQEILGCIAGDDTIMVACRDGADAVSLIHKLRGMLER
ncbi:MAG: arginine repressor [Lachnospiraceae bacterium]|nr:arginine repressor [Lachnospiraceae bacterium]